MHRAPPASPPRWPPIEIPGTANVNGEVDDQQRQRTAAEHVGLLALEHDRSAPRIPKIAPDAPTVTASRVGDQGPGRAGEARHDVERGRSGSGRGSPRAARPIHQSASMFIAEVDRAVVQERRP